MDHSNTVLWTIQIVDFWGKLPVFVVVFFPNSVFVLKFRHFIYIFKQYRPWSEGFCRSPLIWVWTV